MEGLEFPTQLAVGWGLTMSSYQWLMDRTDLCHFWAKTYICQCVPCSSHPAWEIMWKCVLTWKCHKIQVPWNVEPTRGGQLPWKVLQSELCMRGK